MSSYQQALRAVALRNGSRFSLNNTYYRCLAILFTFLHVSHKLLHLFKPINRG